METRKWEVKCYGKKFGKIEVKQTEEKIVLTITIDPDPDLEVRTFASGGNSTEYVFKEKKKEGKNEL